MLASTEAVTGLIEELSRETTDVHALTNSLAAALETGQTLALPIEPPQAEPAG
ncbi:hypothetical protein [Kribbella catacumbae]|uniref:hypothetical protein n=1 Tax=Kribbella catacumbae TaxID=460086 RepID=UPI000364715E|nr:hypothetical protein [Kribbella catacumbae]